jgi:hypothetical protein
MNERTPAIKVYKVLQCYLTNSHKSKTKDRYSSLIPCQLLVVEERENFKHKKRKEERRKENEKKKKQVKNEKKTVVV